MDHANPADRNDPVSRDAEVNERSYAADDGAQPQSLPRIRLIEVVVTLALAAGLLFWLWNKLGPTGILSIAYVAIGLGLVVFIHELGHFAVAKWCDVYVETFSIGFGPAIPGCSFRRGETLYKIAWFPLGGYVKMLGEGEPSDEADEDPRSFKNKPVWQRTAIISAGVIMNVLFGMVCFIAVYMLHGVERPPAVVDLVDAGSPAWQKGVPTGAIIRQVGSIINPYFDDLKPEVAFSSKGQKLLFVYQPPGQPDKLEKVLIEPRREENDPSPVIGVTPPGDLKLFPKSRGAATLPSSAAAAATPPFEPGDSIVAATAPDHPDRVTSLDGDYFAFENRLSLLAGKPMVVRVRRQGANPEDQATEVDIQVPPAFHYVFGMRMRMGQVVGVREQSPAAAAGVIARDPQQGVLEGDLIDAVEVVEADGTKTRYVSSRSKPVPPDVKNVKDLDPVRLPDTLRSWAATTKGGKKVKLFLLRSVERQSVTLELNWDERWKFDREIPFSTSAPQAIPELGLAYRVGTTVEAVDEKMPDGSLGPAAKAGILRGDVIKAIRFQVPRRSSPLESEPAKWMELDSDEWAQTFWSLQAAEVFKQVTVRVERDGKTDEYELIAVPDDTWPLANRGLNLMPAYVLQKADSVGQAVQLGMQRTFRMIGTIYLSLRAMLTGRVSARKNVGGPIMIAATAYALAGEDLYSFIFFLGLISINLAVINFLPIPILDGGHIVFLVYEKIRGIPASESVRSAATIVGLALILTLFVFTLWLDISRFF